VLENTALEAIPDESWNCNSKNLLASKCYALRIIRRGETGNDVRERSLVPALAIAAQRTAVAGNGYAPAPESGYEHELCNFTDGVKNIQ
jgi:hypothetical protein